MSVVILRGTAIDLRSFIVAAGVWCGCTVYYDAVDVVRGIIREAKCPDGVIPEAGDDATAVWCFLVQRCLRLERALRLFPCCDRDNAPCALLTNNPLGTWMYGSSVSWALVTLECCAVLAPPMLRQRDFIPE